jgi:hypothetical protein
MKEDKLVEKILKEEKVLQRAAAHPIFVLAFEETFLHLEKYLGETYAGIVLKISNGYGDFCYLKKDFPIVLAAVDKKIKENPNFLKDFKKLYEDQFSKAWDEYQQNIKETDILKIFKSASNVFMHSVGVGHIIEPISILGTHNLKDELAKIIKDPKELSNALNVMTTPEKKSFSNEYDDSLAKIAKEIDPVEKEELIKKHIQKYYWIKNSYAGSRELTKKDILDELKSLRKENKNYFDGLKEEKQKIIEKYKINSEIQELAERLLFVTSWQDERKMNILKVVAELSLVLHKISEAFKVDLKSLYVTTPEEILAKKFLNPEQVEERNECFLWILSKPFNNNQIIIVGEKAEKMYKKFAKEKISDGDTLDGICASTGSAIDRKSVV